MTWTRQEIFSDDRPILAFVDGVETPRSVTIPVARIMPDVRGRRILPEGMFFCRIGEIFSPLPRATVTAEFATTRTTGKLSPHPVFLPGDVLRGVEPYGSITVGGTWVSGDQITVTVAGQGAVLTVGSTALPDVAAQIVNAVNNGVAISGLVRAAATGNVVYLFAQDAISLYTLSATTTSAAGTVTASGASFSAGPLLGTVLMVATDGTVTLSANAAVNLPVGARVGVAVSEILGLHPHSLDLTSKPYSILALVTGARGVYEHNLPYIDGEIKRRFPKIYFAQKF